MLRIITEHDKLTMRRHRGDEQYPENGFEAWGGYMQAKISKLEQQFSSRADKEENQVSDIFNGVSIYVNGYTNPSADELKSLMSRHGGVYHTYQKVEDYIIASNLPDTKVKKMSLVKVVRPEWITDSITCNRLLDFRDYLLFKNSKSQPQLNFTKVIKNDTCDDSKQSIYPKLQNLVEAKESAGTFESGINSNKDANCINSIKETSNSVPKVPINGKCNVLNDIPQSNTKIQTMQQCTKTAVDPNFITEFYNNSRLHHISQLGACFKQHVNELRENSNFLFPARVQLKENTLALCNTNLSPVHFEREKIIMHIDMDCFFVSVGLRSRPALHGKPIAVTHSKGGQTRPKRPGVDRNAEFNLYKQKLANKFSKDTGVPEEEFEIKTRLDDICDEGDKYGSMSEIASCSYEARAKGIHNGMFMGSALKLCPDLQTIPYDFEGYKEVAYTLYNTIAQYTLDIEAVSCDEMYVDCTDILKTTGISVQDLATVIRDEIKTKTGCPCSTGFGGNRLQARLATKRAKPDGQFFLTSDLVEDFMFDIKLQDLPGVGRQTAQKLEAIGHQTCGSLQHLTLASLKVHLGNKTGAQLFDQCRGKDQNPLIFHTVRKSVSAEVNYGIRFESDQQCLEFLKQLSMEVHSRMVQCKVLGKCITLKLMIRAEEAPVETAKFLGHGFCDVINKSTSLSSATNDVDVITTEVVALCKRLKIDPKEMRGVGIQISKLETINSKVSKGAINKYLSNTKLVRTDNKQHKEQDVISNLPIKEEISENKQEPKITPKKVKTVSPKRKSPIILMKSPGKKRGRPSKSSKLHTSKNLMSKFLQGQTIRDTPYRDPMAKELEHDEYELSVQKITEEPQSLIGLAWRQVRELLRAWLGSNEIPLPCDINMVTVYMREMVLSKDIDKLNILLSFLRRRTRELDSKEWLMVYEQVVDEIQNTMMVVYGKRLWICD